MVLLFLCAAHGFAQEEKWGMNNPYIDDKLFHLGFQVGLNFNSLGTNWAPANVKDVGFGARIGLIGDVRICKYLNFRFTPGIEFTYKTLKYTPETGIYTGAFISSIPFFLPVYLKFSAEREGNYRPYVIAGGGLSLNMSKYDDQQDKIGLKILDYFCEVGFGCDIYFRWFKLCPEITYRFGFGDQLDPNFTQTGKEVYVDQLKGHLILNQAICLTFNFQN